MTFELYQYLCDYTDVSGRKGMFYLMTNSTHFIYGYMVLDSNRGNLLLPLHGLLFLISSKGSFIYNIPQIR